MGVSDPTIRAALEAATDAMQGATDPNGCVPPSPQDRAAAAIAAFLRALPRDWRDINTGSLRGDVQAADAITGWTEDTTRDGPETSAHWHAMRLAAAVEAAAKEDDA